MIRSKAIKTSALSTAAILTALGTVTALYFARAVEHQRLNSQLVRAIERRDDSVARALIRQGATGDATYPEPHTTGIAGSVKAKLARITGRQPPKVNSGTPSKSTLYEYYEKAEMAEDESDDDGSFAPPSEQLAQQLLETGSPAVGSSSDPSSLLKMAIHFHHHTVVRGLLDRGVSPNVVDGPTQTPPLFEADEQDALILINAGASVDWQNYYGYTALCRAAPATAEVLIAHGASVDGVQQERPRPLLTACDEGNDALALVLVSHHATVNVRDKDGRTPTLCACEICRLETVQALVRAGGGVLTRDGQGNTAAMLALDNRDARVLPWLLSRHVDVNATGTNGNSALSIADQYATTPPDGSGKRERYRAARSLLTSLGARHVKPRSEWPGRDK